MALRGIRGAITVDENSPAAVSSSTKELISNMISQNNISVKDIASVFFTATDDIDSAYPAVAAREIGFSETPLFCSQEMKVKGSLRMCVRVLIHINTESEQKEMKHVYLRGARILRPDIT